MSSNVRSAAPSKTRGEGLTVATAFRPEHQDEKVRHLTMGASLCRSVLAAGNRLTFATAFFDGGADCQGSMMWANRVARSRVGELRRKVASSWRRLCKLCTRKRKLEIACARTEQSPCMYADIAAASRAIMFLLHESTRHHGVLRANYEPHNVTLCL